MIADPIAFAQKQVQLGAVVADRLLPFARAEALAAEGWQAYALVDNETARARLSAAFVAALSVADLAGGVELVAETALRLAVIEFELGDATSSSANFRLAQRLAPDRAVTDNEFKPAVVTAFQAAVSAPTVKRAVSVVIEPSDATVEVDGTTRVTSGSGTSLDLEVGLHLVVVSAPSLNAESTIAVVPSGGPATIGAKLTRDRDVTGVFSPPPEVGMASADAASVIEATSLFAEVDSTVLVAAVLARKGSSSDRAAMQRHADSMWSRGRDSLSQPQRPGQRHPQRGRQDKQNKQCRASSRRNRVGQRARSTSRE